MIRARFSMRFLFIMVAFAAIAAMILSWLVRSGVGGDMLRVVSFAGIALALILVAHALLAILARALSGPARPSRSLPNDAPLS
jgi:hypothetical protein